MSTPRHAQTAAALLRALAPEPGTPSQEDRAFLLAHLEEALLRKARRRRRARAGVGLLAAAAIAAGFAFYRPARQPPKVAPTPSSLIAVARPTGDGAELVGASGSRRLIDGQPLPAGSHLITDDNGGASLGLSTGTALSLEHDADLAVVSAGAEQRFQLLHGSLSARVAKLTSGERFVLVTPDSEVEVHGTAFRVSVAELDARCEVTSRTRVDVSEGIVEVRSLGRSWFVRAGESWPAGCEATAPGVPAPARAVPSASGSARAPEAAHAKAASSLGEQNDLFAQGVAAVHARDTPAALRAFETLARKFPATPLGETAAVKRMQLLRNADPAAAVGAAREYLQRYPSGYARAEADEIARQ